MKINSETRAQDLVIKPEGALDMACQPQLKEGLAQLLADSKFKRIIIDLSLVPFVDSACLGVFVSLVKDLKAAKKESFFVSPQEEVAAIFQITRLDKMFMICESMADLPVI
ncbi:MAG: hypothetical protein ACD_73C00334G0001 [uncultured bacterium]|nr:MAG: hypothetical protein ACD_73C00334G0001 [uncultured bacterium]